MREQAISSYNKRSNKKKAKQEKSSVFLPPAGMCLHNPNKDGLIPTPLDERGLVDLGKLIGDVRSTVVEGYDWSVSNATLAVEHERLLTRAKRRMLEQGIEKDSEVWQAELAKPRDFIMEDTHHLQWPRRHYGGDDAEEGVLEYDFRELAISKAFMPRVFHNWIHKITEPPPMPAEEIMRYRIDAQAAAMMLFNTVKDVKRYVREHKLEEEDLERELIQRSDQFIEGYERAISMPPEFQLVNYQEYEPNETEDMLRLSNRLGRVVTPRVVHRAVLGQSSVALTA